MFNCSGGIHKPKFANDVREVSITITDIFVSNCLDVGLSQKNHTGLLVCQSEVRQYSTKRLRAYCAEKNGKTKELAAEWKNKLGIKTSPINAFLKNEENARLSQHLARIETDIDEIPDNVEEYGLNVDREGLKNVIEKYAMTSLKVYM